VVIRRLLDAGADVNLRSRDRDNSPLMDAAAEGLTDIVRELISRGADLDGLSRNGQSALVLAIGKGAQDVAAILLEGGADPFVVDKLGMNACQYAQLLGRQDFLALVASKFPGQA
jgi:ankyrin repeat protein